MFRPDWTGRRFPTPRGRRVLIRAEPLASGIGARIVTTKIDIYLREFGYRRTTTKVVMSVVGLLDSAILRNLGDAADVSRCGGGRHGVILLRIRKAS